jgi:hypothetical protein
MGEYLVLLKLNPGRIVDAIDALRNLPDKPSSGVDLCYTMNIFGAWDVGVWINADSNNQAIEFVQKKVKDISGVADVYTIPTFPHGTRTQKTQRGREEPSSAKTQ